MVISKRLGLNDVGSPTQVGGNDWDEYYDFHNGVNLAGKSANIQTPITLGNATVTLASLDLIGNVNAPSPTNNQQLLFDSVSSEWKAKNHPTLSALTVYWHMWIDATDGDKVKATNGLITYEHANDAGFILRSIFNDMGSTPFIIFVAPGIYIVRSWTEPPFRKGKFKIIGAGYGVSIFRIHQDTLSVGGSNRAFAFEANGGQYTQISLAANAPIDSFAVMTDSITNLENGCHVMIGSNLTIPNTAAKTGQHNRIVKIVETGTTPAYRIILEKNTSFDFNTIDGAWIRRVDFLEDQWFEGFTIEGDPSLTSSIGVFRADFVYNRTVKNVQIKDWAVWNAGGFHNGLVDNVVVDSLYENIIFEQSPERGHSTGQNAVGYAISTRSGCESVFYVNCRFTGLIRHAFTTTANGETAKVGHPRNIWVINCKADTTDECSFDTHGEGDGIHFVNCSVNGSRSGGGSDTVAGTEDTDAFNSRSKNTRFINCVAYNNRGSGFSCEQPGCVFDHCYVMNTFLNRKAFNIGASKCVMKNCYAENIQGAGVTVANGADDFEIDDNTFNNCCSVVTTESVISVGTGCERGQINDNKINGCPDHAIELQGSNHDTQINDNSIVNAGQTNSVAAIRVVDSLRCMVNDNKFVNCDRPLTMEGTSDRLIYDGNSSNGCDNAKTMVGANNSIGTNNE